MSRASRPATARGRGRGSTAGWPGAASLIGAKVLNSSGSGSDADVAAAIEWCAGRSDVRVISMSLGSPGGDGSDIGSQMADAAAAAGKVVVVAAGNTGTPPARSPLQASPPTSSPSVPRRTSPLWREGSTPMSGCTSPGFPGGVPRPTPPRGSSQTSCTGPECRRREGQRAPARTSRTPAPRWRRPSSPAWWRSAWRPRRGARPAAIKSALQTTARDAGAAGADNEWGHGLVDARAFLAALGGATAGTSAWPGHQLVEGSVGSAATRDVVIEVRTAGARWA